MPERLVIRTADGDMPVWRDGEGDVGLIVFMDVFGIRPELHEMCAAYAGRGYTTFLPDLFYRAGSVAFPTDEPLPPEAKALNTGTTLDMTAADIRALLAATPGPHALAAAGFCMGARHVLAAAASHPARIRACALLHGGRLVTQDAASPHHLIAGLSAPAYVAFAADDPTCPPAHQALVEAALRDAPPAHVAEHLPARHGFMFPERDVHDPASAARATEAMFALFGRALTESVSS